MSYDKHDQSRVILTNKNYKRGIVICDKYDIEIVFTRAIYLPMVRETGGRFEEIRQQKKISDIRDLHICKSKWDGKDGWACMCSRLEEQIRLPPGSSIDIFFYELLIPFFYAQSYFSDYGKYPWGTYSHGAFGIIESYMQLRGGKGKEFAKACVTELMKEKKGKGGEEAKKCIELLKRKKIRRHWPCICDNPTERFYICHPKIFAGLRSLKKDIRKYNMKKYLI